MRLTHAILSSNDNTNYFKYWPIVRDAWRDIVGIPATLVYVGEELDPSLIGEPNIVHWKPVAGWPTATQAQCARLLVAGLIDTSGAVVIGDIDCMPLSEKFFKKCVEPAADNQFVSFISIMEEVKEVAMMYVAATPATWRDLFGIRDMESARQKMAEWASTMVADGNHGGVGWTSDQNELYRRVDSWRRRCPERLFIHDYPANFPRLDRAMMQEWYPITDNLKARIYMNYYVDFHMPRYYCSTDQRSNDILHMAIEEILRTAYECKKARIQRGH